MVAAAGGADKDGIVAAAVVAQLRHGLASVLLVVQKASLFSLLFASRFLFLGEFCRGRFGVEIQILEAGVQLVDDGLGLVGGHAARREDGGRASDGRRITDLEFLAGSVGKKTPHRKRTRPQRMWTATHASHLNTRRRDATLESPRTAALLDEKHTNVHAGKRLARYSFHSSTTDAGTRSTLLSTMTMGLLISCYHKSLETKQRQIEWRYDCTLVRSYTEGGMCSNGLRMSVTTTIWQQKVEDESRENNTNVYFSTYMSRALGHAPEFAPHLEVVLKVVDLLVLVLVVDAREPVFEHEALVLFHYIATQIIRVFSAQITHTHK